MDKSTNNDFSNIHKSETRPDINQYWIDAQFFAPFVNLGAPQIASNTDPHIPDLLSLSAAFPTLGNHYFDPYHTADMLKNTAVQRGWLPAELPILVVDYDTRIQALKGVQSLLSDEERLIVKGYVWKWNSHFYSKRPTLGSGSIQQDHPDLWKKIGNNIYAMKRAASRAHTLSQQMLQYGEHPIVRTGLALYRSLYFQPQTPDEERLLRKSLLALIPRLEYWLQSRMNDGRNHYYVSVAGSNEPDGPQSFWLLDTA